MLFNHGYACLSRALARIPRSMSAAALAVVLYLVYLALALGLRTWLLYRQTGATGYNGLSGRTGSAGATIAGVRAGGPTSSGIACCSPPFPTGAAS